MSSPHRHPGAAMLDLSDQGAWEGERKKAVTLEELQSPSGRPYQEDVSSSSRPHARPRYARTDFEIIPGYQEEVAYWCEGEHLWIQGAPAGDEYNDIGPLSGSAGLVLICRSCGYEIGRQVERVS